jgi:hypothetical protein
MHTFTSRCIFDVHNGWKVCVRKRAEKRKKRNGIHCLNREEIKNNKDIKRIKQKRKL